MTPVLLVCDEGPGAGLGHRRRCEAIATALRAQGIAAAVVPSGAGVFAAPVLVVDSYRFRADDRHRFVPDVLVALDDLERDLDVDLVVIPAPDGLTGYESTARRRVLCGAEVALVDPRVAARGVAPLRPDVERILVTMGAADSTGVGASIAGDLVEARPDLDIRLVVGPWGARDVPAGVTSVIAPEGLVEELAAADVVVTAGGVTLLEALVMGRPTVAVAVADNQLANVRAAGAAGAAAVATREHAAAMALRLIDDASRRAALHAAGPVVIDGAGARRVADAIAARIGADVHRTVASVAA